MEEMNFTFEYPYVLLGILLLPIIFFWFNISINQRRTRLSHIASEKILKKIVVSGNNNEKRRLWLSITGFLFLIITCANPRIPVEKKVVKSNSADLMILLDISNSMNTQDILPDRLSVAKRLLERLAQKIGTERVGLIFFAGDCFLASPLTTDISALSELIESANTEMAGVQGTSIGNAIRLAMNAFEQNDQSSKGIIILTDGEDHDSEAIQVAKEAKKENIIISCIGFGTKNGGFVPEKNPETGNQIKMDIDGNAISSKLNEPFLREIVKPSNGEYINAQNSSSISRIQKMISKLDRGEYINNSVQHFKSFYFIPLILALFFYLLEFAYSRKLQTKSSGGIRKFGILGVYIFIFFNSNAQSSHRLLQKGDKYYKQNDFANAQKSYEESAKQKPSFKAKYNEGNANYKNKNYEKSIENYNEALKLSPKSEQLAATYFNLGNSKAQLNQVDGAIEAYKNALRNNPKDQDSKINLTKLLLKKKEQSQNKEEPNDQNQKSDENSSESKENGQNQAKNDQNQADQKESNITENSKNNPSPKNFTKQEAEDFLRILKQNENGVRKKLKNKNGKAATSKKDW